MELVIALVLLVFLGYLVYEETLPVAVKKLNGKRLCDYYAAGSVYEDIPSAIQRGIRLLELHVYSDERDQPVVAKQALNDGYNFAEDNISFEQACVDIVNEAFPSDDPFILSLVFHTEKTVTLDAVADHLLTTVRRHLIPDKEIWDAPMRALANKLVIVSGRVQGTALEPLVNLSWDSSGMRRLEYAQAVHPRDPEELTNFNRDFLTIVGPGSDARVFANPQTPLKYGCQWNLYLKSPAGFVEKPASLQ
jgi:hypothetical protein